MLISLQQRNRANDTFRIGAKIDPYAGGDTPWMSVAASHPSWWNECPVWWRRLSTHEIRDLDGWGSRLSCEATKESLVLGQTWKNSAFEIFRESAHLGTIRLHQ
jgi:hypothetical protein